MKYYPAYLDLREHPCVVIGGGAAAEHKALSLIEAGADVTVISLSLSPKLHELSDSGKITHLQKEFEDQDVSGAFLVIAAADSPAVNTNAAQICKKKHVLVNVDASHEESSFIVPSVVERGDLVIAVSTAGASPALSLKIAQELGQQYGHEYESFLDKLTTIRKRILEGVADEGERGKIFQAIIDSDVVELLRQGKTHEAEIRMTELAGLKHKI